MRCRIARVCVIILCVTGVLRLSAEEAGQKPLFKNFMGVCGHTVQFKSEIYSATCRLVRDYHPVDWDIGEDGSHRPPFPEARNRVNWELIYGKWQKSGFDTSASLMFESIKHDKWKNMAADAKAYGFAFAKFFGPSGKNLVSAVEIGNEPGKYDDAKYRAMLESMARGIREGDPKMKILTCNIVAGKSHDYAKSLNCLEGFNDLYDILNVHTYAQADPWPTWRRSFPEDPKIEYLKEVDRVVAWRDDKAKGKPIWITEFGWDASTKPAPATGTFKKWIGNNDTEQAQWLVRSFMVFAKMPVDRAYIYFFNDSDEPQMHGSSGLTRHFKPKPSFHAVAHQFRTLGDYRFSRTVQEKTGDVYVYEFAHATNAAKRIWAVWSPTGSKRKAEVTLPLDKLKFVRAEQMPLKAGDASTVPVKTEAGAITVPVDESPVYLWLEAAD